MKRGAENQLTKDSLSDDEEIQEMAGTGFKKADQSTLASRPMRGLPKRTGSANSASAPALGSTPTEPPKFGGFAGFGATGGSTSTNSSPFLFTPPSTTTTAPPAVSTNASNTAKTFASFLGGVATANPAPPQSATQTKPAATEEDPAALKYYTSLRGLNISVISALSKTTEEDPFKDVTDVLEQYKAFRSQIQKEYDDQKSKTPAAAPAAPPAAPKSAFSLPSVPSSFAGFGGTTTPASAPSVQSLGGGFTPRAPTTSSSSLFTLPASSSTPSAPAPPTTQSSFSFSNPPAPQGSSASNPFSFSTSSTSTTKEAPALSSSSIFGAPPKPASTAPSSSFGGSSFNFGGNASAPKASALGVPSTSSSGGFTFGAPTTSTLDSSKPTPGSLGAFGSFKSNAPEAAATPASPPKGGFAGFSGFGKPSSGGSLGNPVGFGFGAATKTPEVDSSATSAAASGSEDNGGADSAEAGNNNKTESFSLFGNNPHDEEGEGEEDEETTYQVKLKVYRLKRADDKEGTGWKELGFGVLRLKKHKETGKRRMLLRNSSTGKIHINFNLYSGMKSPTLTKKSLTFMGFEGTIPQNYNVRLPNEEKAAELKAAIEKEVAEIP